MKDAAGWLFERLGEPSTWRGIAMLLASGGLVSYSAVDALAVAGVALYGAVDVIRKERGGR